MVTQSKLVALQKEYAELQKKLQESENLFQVSFNQAPVGMVQCGLEGQIWKANQKFCEIVGYTAEELRSRSFEDLTHPEDLNGELVWAKKLVTGEINTYSLQKRYLKKDGAIARVSLRVNLLQDDKGLPQSVMGFITEITDNHGKIDLIPEEVRQEKAERERAEAALHEYEARFERLAKTLPGMVYQYRQYLNQTDDIFTYVSAACREIYELEPEAVLNNAQLMWQIIHPEDSTGFARSFIRAAETGTEWYHQWRIITPSGKVKWLQGAAKKSPQMDGAILWDGIVLDITDRKLADDAIRQQMEMLDRANDSILIRDLNEKIEYWNQGAERLYGWSLAEVKGQYIHEWLQTRFPEPLSEIMARVLRDGHWRGELIHRKRNGTEVVVESRWTLQRDEQNDPRAILEMNTDISDRKEAEQALKNSEARFRTTFEQAAVGVAHVNFEGRFIRINQRFCDIAGYSKAEMLALTFQEITHPEDLDVDWQLAQQVKHEQITHYSIEKRYIRKDNTFIWVNLTVAMEQDGSYWISVVEDITDRKEAEAARLQTEAKLREKVEQEELLNRLTSQIRNSLDLNQILQTVVSELQRILNLDRCYFLWYHTEYHSPVWSCIQEAKRPHLESFLGEYPIPDHNALYLKLTEGEIVWCDDLVQSPDLNWHSIYLEYGFRAILLVPLRKSNGRLGVICCATVGETRPWKWAEIHLLEAVRDCMEIAIFQAELYKEATARSQELEQTLKQLQKTQTQLIQSEKMASLGQLVAGIAHEINNPVSFIFGNIIHAREYLSDLLEVVTLYDQYYPNPEPEILDKADEVDLDFLKEDFSKLLDSMEQGAIRIREIVTSLRTFSRYDEAALKDVEIHSGLESSLMILKNRLDSQRNRPEIEVIKNYGTLPKVECFASELNQVFINILTNAIDAIDEAYRNGDRQEPGKIWIQTQVLPGDRIAIQIKDNGCGIAENALARLFDPFFTTKPIGKGTGLGLATSYQIAVDRHKGGLLCTSTPGIGTKFTIELPIHQDQFHKDEKG